MQHQGYHLSTLQGLYTESQNKRDVSGKLTLVHSGGKIVIAVYPPLNDQPPVKRHLFRDHPSSLLHGTCW